MVVEKREAKINERMDFIKIPPIGMLVPTKPINLDLFSNLIEYPKLNMKVEEKKGE